MKKGLTMVDVILGFMIISMIVVSFVTISLNQMAQLKKSGTLTKTIYAASKYIQEEIISVQTNIKENKQTNITHPKKKIILFNGDNRTEAEIYEIILKDEIKNADIGIDKTEFENQNASNIHVEMKFDREYVAFVSAIRPKEPEQAVAKEVNMTASFPIIPGIVPDEYNKLVNYYSNNLKLSGSWIPEDASKVYTDKERNTWQLATRNFIAPMFIKAGDIGYDETDPDVGTLYPKFKGDYIEIQGTQELTISDKKYANRNIMYAVRPVSKIGKIGAIKEPKYSSFPLDYPLRGTNDPSLHLDANYITPNNYEIASISGVNKKVLKKLNRPIANQNNGITISGQIVLETSSTGTVFEDFNTAEVDNSLERDIYTRGFSFNGTSASASVSGFSNYKDMTVFVVAKVNEEPSNKIPIISFDDNGNRYRFRLYSTGLSVKSDPNATAESDFLSISTVPEKNNYAVYVIRLNPNGTTNLMVNNKPTINNNVPIAAFTGFLGSIMLSKFGSGASGNVDIAELMVYNTALTDQNLTTLKDYFISKYGIS